MVHSRLDSALASGPRRIALGAVMLLAICAGAIGDTVVLKDGTILEGKVVSKSSKYVRVETRFGKKSIRRADIDRIVTESEEGSALKAIRETQDFDALSPEAQALKNAQALYDLGRFTEIPPLIEPLIGKGTKYDDMRIRWLLIDNHIRQGHWSEAEELIKKTQEDGREPDKIRAQVYLDIFKENPGYSLRKIGEARSRDFMEWDVYLEAKQPNALQNPKVMEAALREVLSQTLHDQKISVAALKEDLNVDETLGIIQRELDKPEKERKTKSYVKLLPYVAKLEAVEKSLYKADAIIPGAARGFQLDLVRTEADHLREVITRLLTQLSAAYPGSKTVATDEHGRLNKQGREQWRKMCDDFLELCKPVTELIEYLLQRAGGFPDELQPFIKEWEDTLERVEQMKQNTVRNYDRTT